MRHRGEHTNPLLTSLVGYGPHDLSELGLRPEWASFQDLSSVIRHTLREPAGFSSPEPCCQLYGVWPGTDKDPSGLNEELYSFRTTEFSRYLTSAGCLPCYVMFIADL